MSAIIPTTTTKLAPDQHPGPVYLATLGSAASRRSMVDGLRRSLAVATGRDTVAVEAQEAASAPWWRLTYGRAQALVTALQDTYGTASVQGSLAALRGVLREAFMLGHVDGDTYQRLRAVLTVKSPRRVPAGRLVTRREVARLAEACDLDTALGARDAALLSLLYGLGLRVSEASALLMENVDTRTGRILVVGKGGHERHVWATNGTVNALRAWCQLRGRKPGSFLRSVDRHGNVRAGALSSRGARVALARLADRAHAAPFTCHDLRRSHVSEGLAAGADLATVQRAVGHASPTTTARYDRRPDEAVRSAQALVALPF